MNYNLEEFMALFLQEHQFQHLTSQFFININLMDLSQNQQKILHHLHSIFVAYFFKVQLPF